jgi:hypothetical protein
MRYYADTDIGAVRIEETDGVITVTREGLAVFRTRFTTALANWLEFHKGILKVNR